MSLGTLLLGALVACIITPWCSAGYCSQGDLGKICKSDLSGYHECVIDPQTGRVRDLIRKCPTGTRCNCMGSICKSVGNPCAKYTLPPIMPDSYHYEYNEQLKRCTPAGCKTTYSRRAVWRDYENLKLREDRTIGGGHDPPYEYFITAPYGRGWMLKFHIIPSKRSCTYKLASPTSTLPPKIAVPTKFRFHGHKYVYGDYCKRWLWLERGRYPNDATSYQIWDTAHTIDWTNRIVQYTAFYPDSVTKKSTLIERYYYTFAPGVPSKDVFELPTYCHI